MQDFPYLDIVLLGLVTGFIAFRLYTVLGRRTGHERGPEEKLRDRLTRSGAKTAPAAEPLAPIPERLNIPQSGPVATGPVARALTDIKLSDRHFDTEKFLGGARSAHEMIVTAFAKNDRDTLRPLLSDDVYETFEKAIAARELRKEKVDFTFLALKNARLTAAELKNHTAEITITFESEIMLAGYDANGALIEGDAKTPHIVTDIWTFARDMRSGNPNWTLVSTASGS